MMLLKDYMDDYGLMVQRDKDGGDSAYMTALTSGLLLIKEDVDGADVLYRNLTSQCVVQEGIWRRHPDPLKWYANPNNFSRDQAETVLWCLAVWSIISGSRAAQQLMKDFFKQKISRSGFHQNVHIGTDVPEGSDGLKVPDITGPEEITHYIRANNKWYLWPLLCLLDLSLLINVWFFRKKWDADCLIAKNIIISRLKYSTPCSYLARKIYRGTDYQKRIKNYFYETGNSIEPLGDLYIEVCNKYIN